MRLKDKVAVVTGGSRGIGREISWVLAEKGAVVVICAKNVENLIEVSESIRKNGGICTYVVADISDEKRVDDLAFDVIKTYGRVDILINNAGIGIYKPFIDSTLNDWDNIMRTNLKGPFLCSKAFVPFMMERKNGYIINIASGAGKIGMKNLSVYCASKFGLIGLTESMQKELREFGIKVYHVCPGFVRTTFFKDFPSDFHLPSFAKEPSVVAKEIVQILSGQRQYKFYFDKISNVFTRILNLG